MTTDRDQILLWIEEERDEIVALLQRLVRARSPNPPGDTLAAAAIVRERLDAEALPYRIIDPNPVMPNFVGTFDGGLKGRHLVLNGHIDVFPVASDHGWSRDPWSGDIVDGKLYGRGAADMKPGTTASIVTYALLHRLRDRLKGRLTLTAVSDEETFGPWGARWLMDHEPEVLGDCCLNGEPSGPNTIRFGEKGPLWLRFTVRAPGAHGAYTHTGSATLTATRLIGELERLEDLPVDLPHNVMAAIDEASAAADVAMGQGAGAIVGKVTLNVGLLNGGVKVNMIPSECTFEADIRLPPGMSRERVMAEVERMVGNHPGVEVEETGCNLPSYCDPYGEMVGILQANVQALAGHKPTPIVGLGGTDARLWRYRNIPAYVYGVYPHGMGSHDEHVDIEEFLHVVRTHALSAYDYLMAS
ncbi:succinyl-diaminopimelate desuccinylase [Stella humosa]|uniref:Succinyl-diaminopimelate desuccinylase n=1 Tax=Stella humosa TaxID=94 RepID=A0A3N1MF84_9PROT|nr:M20/M25/M40 family metallo-hydrolase [Stella humosa]ROQ01989.1 succinyl-diaminopimelate desuccinylase [Stella humosa]BBK32378.1 peptidase [Stella humosa]